MRGIAASPWRGLLDNTNIYFRISLNQATQETKRLVNQVERYHNEDSTYKRLAEPL